MDLDLDLEFLDGIRSIHWIISLAVDLDLSGPMRVLFGGCRQQTKTATPAHKSGIRMESVCTSLLYIFDCCVMHCVHCNLGPLSLPSPDCTASDTG